MRGRLMEIRDFNGNSIQLRWKENSGIVTQVVDTAGGEYDFHHDGTLLTNVTFRSWSVDFEHNDSNQLIAKSFSGPAEYQAVKTRWEFEYYTSGDATGLLKKIIDPNANLVTEITYDKYGRKVSEKDALNRERKVNYDKPSLRQLTLTDPEDNQWLETYDRKHRLLSHKDPLGNTVRYEYDEFGNVVKITEPIGWISTYTYDERSNKTEEQNDLGEKTVWDYHAFFNKPVKETNPEGWDLFFVYDASGNIVSNYDGMGTLVSYSYTSNGLLEAATDANGNTMSYAYNSDGFLVSKPDPESNETRNGPKG